jgi:hypothetical protein
MGEPRACRTFREGLTEYLEEALPPARRQGLELHVEGCPSCRSLLEQVRCTIRSSTGLKGAPMPAELRNEILRTFRGRAAD